MAIGQGISGVVSFKKQTALGTAASGAGGFAVRRTSAVLSLNKATYSNNEIVTHQQHTGDIHGVATTDGKIDGILSPLTYSLLLCSLLRAASWTAGTTISSLSITIAASGANWTVTRATGDFLADGIKAGDVIKLTGAGFNTANINVNMIVLTMTSTILTCYVPNAKTLIAEGPIATSTVTVIGKKCFSPSSSQANDYYTFERWQPDLTLSHTFMDMQVASADFTIPATGMVTISLALAGLGKRTKGASQVLTGPTASTTNAVASAAGAVVVGGTRYGTITSAAIKIDGQVAPGEAVVGANVVPDVQRGRIKVTGQFTALWDTDTIAAPFDSEATTSLMLMLADSRLDAANFVALSMPTVKLFSDDPDDGEKQIVRTYKFTAQYNSAGGAGISTDQTTIVIQDSLAA
jgi:hypothetical protein